MEDYRIYWLDADDRTWDYRVIQCADDAAAMTTAARLQSGFPGIEVWVGTRMVQRLGASVTAQLAAAH